MTIRSSTYLKAKFETNDVPVQADYGDWIDSFVPVGTSGSYTSDINYTVNNLTTVSALTIGGVTSAQSVYHNGSQIFDYLAVSANTTVQSTGGSLSATINYVNYANGQNDSLLLPARTQGRIQYIVNAASTTIKIFPAAGNNFVGTAANASLNIPVDRTATVIHCAASAYALLIG